MRNLAECLCLVGLLASGVGAAGVVFIIHLADHIGYPTHNMPAPFAELFFTSALVLCAGGIVLTPSLAALLVFGDEPEQEPVLDTLCEPDSKTEDDPNPYRSPRTI